jgi:hypothetical protein
MRFWTRLWDRLLPMPPSSSSCHCWRVDVSRRWNGRCMVEETRIVMPTKHTNWCSPKESE